MNTQYSPRKSAELTPSLTAVSPLRNVLCLLLGLGISSDAGTMDFETVNGLVPFEGMEISNQFAPEFGVTFSRIGGGFPVIIRKGLPLAAFQGPSADLVDELSPLDPKANDFGDYYLSDDAGFSSIGYGLILDYSAPVSQASGYIFDVDGADRVSVVAYRDTQGADEISRTVVTVSTKGAGDGRAVLWSFNRPLNDIRQIRLLNSGDVKQNVAFDHLSSDFVPLPAAAASVQLQRYAGLMIQGDVGRAYRVEYTDRLEDGGPSQSVWNSLADVVLSEASYFFTDMDSPKTPNRFYRVVSIP